MLIFLLFATTLTFATLLSGNHVAGYQLYKNWESREDAPFLSFDDLFEDTEFYGQTHMLWSKGDLRLTVEDENASGGRAGRLEMYMGHHYSEGSGGRVEFEGSWGTVCGQDFNLAAANVACRQMGFKSATGWNYTMYTPFGIANDSVSIAVSDVKCPASYLWHMMRCNVEYGSSGSSCTHQKDVAVFCSPDMIWDTPYRGQVRLNTQGNASIHSYGRIEVFLNGQWGTVCNMGFTQVGADSACRQLGYTGAVYSGAALPGSGAIFVNHMTCDSSQPCFTNCYKSHAYVHDCNHTMDIAIQCEFDVTEASTFPAGYKSECAINEFPLVILLLCTILALSIVILVGCVIVFSITTTRCCCKRCRKRKRYEELF